MVKWNAPNAVEPVQDLGKTNHARNTRALIQWPTHEELDRVSVALKCIHDIGKSSEADGDYFKSGDVAYQLHEIVRATKELLKKSLRCRGQ